MPGGVVTTLAGTPFFCGAADGVGSSATFRWPVAVRADAINVYVADMGNHRIRAIMYATKAVRTLAGGGSIGGIGSAATFNKPYGVAPDLSGNVFVVEAGNHAVRKIVVATATVTTLAGGGALGSTPGYVNGVGTNALFNTLLDIAVDFHGNVYAVDTGNNLIRYIKAASGVVTTLAGGGSATGTAAGAANGLGTAATLNQPYACAVDESVGNIYIADGANHQVRWITVTYGSVTASVSRSASVIQRTTRCAG